MNQQRKKILNEIKKTESLLYDLLTISPESEEELKELYESFLILRATLKRLEKRFKG